MTGRVIAIGTLGNPHQSVSAGAAQLMAGLDGIENKIDMWISYKREVEVDVTRMRPTPVEFALYFDC
jgi:glutamine synthetase